LFLCFFSLSLLSFFLSGGQRGHHGVDVERVVQIALESVGKQEKSLDPKAIRKQHKTTFSFSLKLLKDHSHSVVISIDILTTINQSNPSITQNQSINHHHQSISK
jgi:hypothetical protein